MAGWLLYSLYTPYLFMLILEASSFVTFSLLSELDFFFFFLACLFITNGSDQSLGMPQSFLYCSLWQILEPPDILSTE